LIDIQQKRLKKYNTFQMSDFLEKIKVAYDDEMKKKNEEITSLKKELILQREKMEDVVEYIKDKLHIDGTRGVKNPFDPVRGFPSRAAGDPDDPYDSIRY